MNLKSHGLDSCSLVLIRGCVPHSAYLLQASSVFIRVDPWFSASDFGLWALDVGLKPDVISEQRRDGEAIDDFTFEDHVEALLKGKPDAFAYFVRVQ